MRKPGYIYVAVDEAHPGYCKVGQTVDIEQRKRTIGGQSLNKPVIVGFAFVDDTDAVESALHAILP